MKIAEVNLGQIHLSDEWYEMYWELFFDKFKKTNPELDEDDLSDKFYNEFCSKFEYGEYAEVIIKVDENFNIVGGEVVKTTGP